MCVPDWTNAAFSDYSAQEYSTSFSSPRGRNGVHSVSRAVVGQARMYPLAQAALNLRALWLLWVQTTLINETSFCTASSYSQVLVQDKHLSDVVASEANVNHHDHCALIKTPTAVLTRWLSDWAAKRTRTIPTTNTTTNITNNTNTTITTTDLTSNSSSRNKNKVNSTPLMSRTSSRSQLSSNG